MVEKFLIFLCRYTIKDLDLHGAEMAFVPFKEFGIMRNLRTVGIAKTQGKILNIPGKHLENFHPNELSNSFYVMWNSNIIW